MKILAHIILAASFVFSAAAFETFAQKTAAELGVYRPESGVFYKRPANDDGSFTAVRWGLATDTLVPADYDGDGIIDAAVWRPESGVWYIQQSSDGAVLFVKWGYTAVHQTGLLPDVPVPADYDGDGRADIAVWRPDTGDWYVLKSSTGYDVAKAIAFHWGKLGDVPVPKDYDGDGLTDFAVFRPLGNQWFIRQSTTGEMRSYTFGSAGQDVLVPADYTGDGKADIAVYRRGTWYVLNSESGETEPLEFGFSDAAAVPADYDGDGVTDFAVFRRGVWYIYESARPRLRSTRFGSENDVPLNSLNVRPSMVAIP